MLRSINWHGGEAVDSRSHRGRPSSWAAQRRASGGKGKGDSSTATKGVNLLYLAMAAPGASNVAFSTDFGEREKGMFECFSGGGGLF